MPTETVEINGQLHEIEVRPITLVCQQGDMRIKYKRMEISDQETFYHVDRVKLLHPKTLEFYHIVFPEFLKDVIQTAEPDNVPSTKTVTWFNYQRPTAHHHKFYEWIQSEGSGSRHVFGLIDLTLKLTDAGVPIVWIHPESHLHPSAQLNLADLLLAFHDYYKTDEEKQQERIADIKREMGYKQPPALNKGEINLEKPPKTID